MNENTISVALQMGIPLASTLIDWFREMGAEREATAVEVSLADSDANMRLVISRSRSERGLPPLPSSMPPSDPGNGIGSYSAP